MARQKSRTKLKLFSAGSDLRKGYTMPTIKKIKRRINYIKREYNVTSSGTNHWQRGKNNLLHHHLFELQSAKNSNDKFEIAESIWKYEGSGCLGR